MPAVDPAGPEGVEIGKAVATQPEMILLDEVRPASANLRLTRLSR